MELTRLKRHLIENGAYYTAFRDVLALLDVADKVREEAEYYEDRLKQQEVPSEEDMQRLVPELANMVVDALCSIEGVSPLDVVRRVAAYDSMALKTAYDEWNERDDEPLGDLDEHPF